MRRTWNILILTCFVAFATGGPFALHVHLWHQVHGDQSRHNSSKCPVCQVVCTASRAVMIDAPLLAVDDDWFSWDAVPVPPSPPAAVVPLPIAPRAPPLPTV